ncbi:hypothetical protein RYA05_03315 [Pseudomonas syringae pv. actinidiae]|nr:hypothetical protein [Pseudomonas syringae pv. actinidiae]
MTIKIKKQMTPLMSAMAALATLIGVIIGCTGVWLLVPLLWEGLCITISGIWSVFIYWSNKTHYIGMATCFLTVWSGATIIPLNVTDKYIAHRRFAMVITIAMAVINLLLWASYIATSPGILQRDPGFFDSIYCIFSTISPFAAIALTQHYWKAKHYGY